MKLYVFLFLISHMTSYTFLFFSSSVHSFPKCYIDDIVYLIDDILFLVIIYLLITYRFQNNPCTGPYDHPSTSHFHLQTTDGSGEIENYRETNERWYYKNVNKNNTLLYACSGDFSNSHTVIHVIIRLH